MAMKFCRKIRKVKYTKITKAGTHVLDRWWQGFDHYVVASLSKMQSSSTNVLQGRCSYISVFLSFGHSAKSACGNC